MKNVLVVIGTSHFDPHDLSDALVERRIQCSTSQWNTIGPSASQCDLAVLFGLTEYRETADVIAGTVRAAIGPDTPLLVVSSWNPAIMAVHMKEAYNAEYVVRHGPITHLLEKTLSMVQQSKTAPC